MLLLCLKFKMAMIGVISYHMLVRRCWPFKVRYFMRCFLASRGKRGRWGWRPRRARIVLSIWIDCLSFWRLMLLIMSYCWGIFRKWSIIYRKGAGWMYMIIYLVKQIHLKQPANIHNLPAPAHNRHPADLQHNPAKPQIRHPRSTHPSITVLTQTDNILAHPFPNKTLQPD